MKTTKCNIFLTVLLTISFHVSFGQATGDNTPLTGKFLGYDGPQNLEFRTNNDTRMQLMQSGNSLINGFNIDRSGF